MDNSNATRTTMMAGPLALTVWPDAPVGEHQRYAYRITDTSTGRSLEGRDLFTGAGTPVEPDRAMRDLAGFLTAAGDARQYALDHPGTTGENGGLFPDWVAEAARRNADALAAVEQSTPEASAMTVLDEVRPQRWITVVFLQGAEADDLLVLIDRSGTDAAIEHLAGYDYGEETVQAALENGYVYDDLPTGTVDEVATSGMYTLTYNHHLGHACLFRDYDAPPDPALGDPILVDPAPLDVDALAQAEPQQSRELAAAPQRQPSGPAAGADWFSQSPRPGQAGSGLSGRGLSL